MSRSKEQVAVVKSGFDASSNRLFNKIAEAITTKIKEDTGVVVTLVGRVTARNKVTATMIATVEAKDQDDVEEKTQKVDAAMQALKNPALLMDLIG